jgi:hypothetical protein
MLKLLKMVLKMVALVLSVHEMGQFKRFRYIHDHEPSH